ncbi:MAG: hypothetical protein DRO39_07065 [Thermoprotei archaeon]|nr:MAG: hypothetical protein DRO39_07065 [Thermoprotei archaeon]
MRSPRLNKRKFEEFFIRWFAGPSRDASVLREYTHTINASRAEKPDFVEWDLHDWQSALREVLEYYETESHYLGYQFYSPDGRPLGYHYIYFDFDCKDDLSRARQELERFAKIVRDRYGIDVVPYFSGRKGYGAVVPVDRYIDWYTYRTIWRLLANLDRFATLDPEVVRSGHRVHRIPYTFNIKPGHIGLCYIVDLRTFEMLPMEDFDWGNYEPLRVDRFSDLINVKIEPFDRPRVRRFSREARAKPRLPDDPAELDDCDLVPPCIRRIVAELKETGSLGHWSRFVLVAFLKWVGYDKEKIIDLFRRFASDFREDITRYQVEHIFGERGGRKDYLCPSCSELRKNESDRRRDRVSLCRGCGWNRNPVTYTYARAYVPEEIRQRFFELVARRRGGT